MNLWHTYEAKTVGTGRNFAHLGKFLGRHRCGLGLHLVLHPIRDGGQLNPSKIKRASRPGSKNITPFVYQRI
eukprot:NODE_286_length_1084_cov_120.353623_g216_i5.p5 GENE.NODE_286_length_1084_cov_120.353623_g216_i5~~NODE_286_length_1084_cov_120.353623_g216_i5.p5  ORF type:complete len:72 (+),score=5.04 NODE_286_length_1084_cov_120.353623_g216_i5:506-721(+)